MIDEFYFYLLACRLRYWVRLQLGAADVSPREGGTPYNGLYGGGAFTAVKRDAAF